MSGNISSANGLELWSGVECTVNRVRNDYFDQLEGSGHSVRSSDIDRLADLGITRIRYPLLWERMAPTSLQSIDWSWSDERMAGELPLERISRGDIRTRILSSRELRAPQGMGKLL